MGDICWSPWIFLKGCVKICCLCAYHRPCHRWAELFDAHCSPRGMSHHLQPVISTYSWVFNTLRNGTCGIPRPLFSGDWGIKSSNNFHSRSLNPSNLPAILSSFLFCLFHLYVDSSSNFDISGIDSEAWGNAFYASLMCNRLLAIASSPRCQLIRFVM